MTAGIALRRRRVQGAQAGGPSNTTRLAGFSLANMIGGELSTATARSGGFRPRLSRTVASATAKEIEARGRSFIRKWRLKCRAVGDSLEEAGGRLFTFLRLPSSQWKSARTTNAIERLHEEFKRRIKTQTVLPSAETAAMLFWALPAAGQIILRKVDGWQTLAEPPAPQCIDLAA